MKKVKVFFLTSLLLRIAVCMTSAVEQKKSMENGYQWLVANQNPDGSWGKDLMRFTDTNQTVATLKSLGKISETYENALQWIKAQEVLHTEGLARKIITLSGEQDVSSLVQLLISHQNRDGGFGGYKAYESRTIDSIFALRALKAASYDDQNVLTRLITYILINQNADGGFGVAGRMARVPESLKASNIYVTSLVVNTFQEYGITVYDA